MCGAQWDVVGAAGVGQGHPPWGAGLSGPAWTWRAEREGADGQGWAGEGTVRRLHL